MPGAGAVSCNGRTPGKNVIEMLRVIGLRFVARDRHHLGIARVVAEWVDHDFLFGTQAELLESVRQGAPRARSRDRTGAGPSRLLQIGLQRGAFGRKKGGARIGVDHERQSVGTAGCVARTTLRTS